MLLINHNTKTYRNPDHACREESQGTVQGATMNKGGNSKVSTQQSPDWLRENFIVQT